jgi:anti-anti-sigma factor
VIVTIAGRVEGAAAVALNPYLHRCVDEHPAVLVVDLGGVEALDGDTLWILHQVGQRARRETCEMRLAGATPATLRAVDAAAMIEDFRIYPTVAAALNLAVIPRMPLAVLDRARKRSRSWLVNPTGPAADGTRPRSGATRSPSVRDQRAM